MNRNAVLTLLLICFFSITYGQNKSKTYLFVGSYTDGKPDQGVYVYEFNTQSGQLKKTYSVDSMVNPSFLTISPNGKYLYTCTETKLPAHGNITAFRIDSTKGRVSYINKQTSAGKNPVYVSVYQSNRFVVTGNYSDGTVTVLRTHENGSLHPPVQTIPFMDSSINKARQDRSHIHSTVFSPQNDYLYLSDLGADKIRAFKFDTSQSEPLISADNYTVHTKPGSGPRHFTFHPNQKFAYCIEELSGMVVAYSYSQGKLDSLQSIFSYSKKQETYSGADIHISPDGLFLYTSNRGEQENTIAIFSIAPMSGKLKLVGHQTTYGNHPRNFTIDPTGKFLLVANQMTNNIIVFKRNKKTGLLSKSQEINVSKPSCLQMRTYKTLSLKL